MNSRIVRGPRVLGAAVLLGALFAAPAAATVVPETAVGQACEGDEGVTVIVDSSDIGGEVKVGCAKGAQESGRSALAAAGFTAEDVTFPGMVDTIDALPDPVPEEFDGNYWAYWFVGESGEWESYMVGFDESTPEAGSVEGWRYSDGSLAPGAEGSALADGVEAPAEEEAPAEAEVTTQDDAAAEDSGSGSTAVWITAVAVILVAIVALYAGLTARNRKQQ